MILWRSQTLLRRQKEGFNKVKEEKSAREDNKKVVNKPEVKVGETEEEDIKNAENTN